MALVQEQTAVTHFWPLEHQQERSCWCRDLRGGDSPFGAVVQDNDLDVGRGSHAT
jgi:hypothetical protein